MENKDQAVKEADKLVSEMTVTSNSNIEETKKPKKQPKKQEPKLSETELAFNIFNACELRVGEIVEVNEHPESSKLYIEKIDMGGEIRTILSGLKEHIPIEDMKKKVIIFANLKPRKIAGIESNGMVMCAGDSARTKFALLMPCPDAKLGELVTLDHPDFTPAENFKAPNNKAVDKFLKKLNTSSEGVGRFDEFILKTESGLLLPTGIKDGSIS